MSLRSAFSTAWEWIFRRAALRNARTGIANPGERRGRAHRQSRLVMEVARRVSEPVERFPPGARPAVLLSLYRDAAYWALIAGAADDRESPADLNAAWAGYPPDGLLRAASDEPTLSALERSLVRGSPQAALDATGEDADRARKFVEAVLAEQEGPRRRVERILLQRWSRLLLVAATGLAIAFGIHRLTLGPNLVAGKPMRTSSSWPGCSSDAGCTAQLFHTEPQSNPWVEFDLLAARKIRRVEVTNRTDCCGERAVPLVVEVGNDRVNWTQIGRRDAEFSSWTLTFPPRTARYVRLRVAGHSTFHLKDVAIR